MGKEPTRSLPFYWILQQIFFMETNILRFPFYKQEKSSKDQNKHCSLILVPGSEHFMQPIRAQENLNLACGLGPSKDLHIGSLVSHWFSQQATSDCCVHAKYFLCLTGDHSVCKTGFVVKPVTSLKL